MNLRNLIPIAATLCLAAGSPAQKGEHKQDAGKTKAASKEAAKKTEKKEELTLEKLFPKKGLFGPSASSMAFSFDGVLAAYLYRPYIERRHGSDLWIVDGVKGTSRRITSAVVMAEFQKSARKVRDDRMEKARKKRAAEKKATEEKATAKKKEAKKEKGTSKKKDEKELGDQVDKDDAKAEKAPRYSGISRFVWSPVSKELLFTSRGDIYRYKVADGSIERLTCTRSRESSVAYLPDGSGYTYMRDSALYRVRFGNHLVEQIDPELSGGAKMSRYRLSPDGKCMAILATRGQSSSKSGHKVNIASYRERFMKVREVPRQVSDDPPPKVEWVLYLYEIGDSTKERGELALAHTHKRSGPRDIFQLPEWSEDSKHATFAVFEQSSGQVSIFESSFAEKKKKKPATKKDEEKKKPTEAGKQGADKKDEGAGKANESTEKKSKSKDEETKAVTTLAYRFFHNGGPNTPSMIRPRYLADNRRIVFLGEQSGFRQLYVLDPLYQSLEQITRGKFEVYPFKLSKDRKTIYATATKEHPARQAIYAIDLESGAMKKLSPRKGVYTSVAVSRDGSHALGLFSCFGSLRELVAVDCASGEQKPLTDSHPEKAHRWTRAVPEFFSYHNRHGHTIYGDLFKPDGWSKKDKRPLLVYVYGGPLGTRKMVTDGSYSADSYFFAWYMAKKHGYLTCTIDPRGVSGYGAVFEKANFEHAGKPQVEDLVDGVKYLIANYGVDPERVGIHGWSFGGFQTQMCMYTAPDVFKVGMAGAGPTEWENYNSWYSQGTIGKTGVGTADLKKYSLLPLAKNLKGKLLLAHGMEDSNVLYQDTVRVYRELLKAGKETQVELFLDPTGGHGLGGDIKRLGRARKYEDFLLRNLGEGKPAEASATGKDRVKKKVDLSAASTEQLSEKKVAPVTSLP